MWLSIRFGNHDDEETGRSAPLIDAALDLHDRLFALHQLLVKASAFSFEQQVTGERQSVELGFAARRNFPAEREGRHGRKFVQVNVNILGDLRRLRDIDRRRLGLTGNGGEVLLDQRPGFGLIKIAGDS